MNIAVAVRLMPKAGDELELDSSGTDIDREYVEMTITDFDDQALEEAVLIKEATGATVTAVGLQAEGIEQALRVAYARGADRVVVVDAGELGPYDSRTAALAFARGVPASCPPISSWPASRRRRTCSVRRHRSSRSRSAGRRRTSWSG